MFGNAGAVAEVGSLAIQNDGVQVLACPQAVEELPEAGHHGPIQDVSPGGGQGDAGDLAAMLEPHPRLGAAHALIHCAPRPFTQGAISTIRSSFHAAPSARRWRRRTKSTSRCCLSPKWKARNPALASVIMLSASQARWISLLRFQWANLCV